MLPIWDLSPRIRTISLMPFHFLFWGRMGLSTNFICRLLKLAPVPKLVRENQARVTDWFGEGGCSWGTIYERPFLEQIAVLFVLLGLHKHEQFCFTYRGQPIGWQISNTAWLNAVAEAGLQDFRFHDLRHTWASWHRQAGTSCDELKDLGGWKSRQMVDRYAKFATENMAFAASRIENGKGGNVVSLVTFLSRPEMKKTA
jgi:hypothetical protein